MATDSNTLMKLIAAGVIGFIVLAALLIGATFLFDNSVDFNGYSVKESNGFVVDKHENLITDGITNITIKTPEFSFPNRNYFEKQKDTEILVYERKVSPNYNMAYLIVTTKNKKEQGIVTIEVYFDFFGDYLIVLKVPENKYHDNSYSKKLNKTIEHFVEETV